MAYLSDYKFLFITFSVHYYLESATKMFIVNGEAVKSETSFQCSELQQNKINVSRNQKNAAECSKSINRRT